MGNLKENIFINNKKRFYRLAIVISLMAILISITGIINLQQVKSKFGVNDNVEESNALVEIQKSKILRVGYGGFPPYTIINPNESDPQKQVSGYSIDLIKEIANSVEPALKIEWVRFSWETIQTELQSGKFDIIADPVYQTVPRALEFSFSIPYAYFGIAVGIVRKDDNRFKSFKDLNRDDITISLAKGWTSSEYAYKYLDKPNFKEVPVTGDAFNQLDDVMLGRADVALNDVPTVIQYAKAHSNKVKAIFIDNPPSSVPGGFVTRQDELELTNFLNTSIYILMANGTLEKLDEKWKTFHHIPIIPKVSGTGLKN